MHLDTVNIVDQPQHANAARLRLSAAIGLGLTSIAASILLLTVDGIGGSVHWTHHAGASAAPLLLVAGAIATVSVAHPPKGRHGLMRVVAVLAFAAWGIAQLFPDSAASGALNDLAILLFVIDAAIVVISDARTLRRARRPPAARVAARTPGMEDTGNAVRPGLESATTCSADPAGDSGLTSHCQPPRRAAELVPNARPAWSASVTATRRACRDGLDSGFGRSMNRP